MSDRMDGGLCGPRREGESLASMHGHEKSGPVVVMKPANKGGQPPAELVERRAGTPPFPVKNSCGGGARRSPRSGAVMAGVLYLPETNDGAARRRR